MFPKDFLLLFRTQNKKPFLSHQINFHHEGGSMGEPHRLYFYHRVYFLFVSLGNIHKPLIVSTENALF